MKKVLFLASLKFTDTNKTSGVTIKNQLMLDFLKKSNLTVNILNTTDWKSQKIPICIKIIRNFFSRKYDFLIISVATSSALWILRVLKVFFFWQRYKVIYIVVGGTLIDKISKSFFTIECLKRCECIFVETKEMCERSKQNGLTNVMHLPNFRTFESKRNYCQKTPDDKMVRLIYLARICPEKGIELSVRAAKYLACSFPHQKIILDVYGRLSNEYSNRFQEIIQPFNNSCTIAYKGTLDYKSHSFYQQISAYDVLLFPTFHDGEGYPGTIIDSMIAGVPVIASNWKYNSELIIHNYNGFLIAPKNQQALNDTLIFALQRPKLLSQMRHNCLKAAEQYQTNFVLNQLLNIIS